jgi:hypothetical protein
MITIAISVKAFLCRFSLWRFFVAFLYNFWQSIASGSFLLFDDLFLNFASSANDPSILTPSPPFPIATCLGDFVL